MKSLGRTLSAAVLTAVIAAPVLAEDLTVTYKTTGTGGDGTSTQYFSSERMRSHDGNLDTLFEYASGTITSIDHGKKQYSQITLAEIEEAMKAARAQMEQAMAQLESMPAAIREKMGKMMGGMAGEVTVTKGGTRDVAGYPTQEYVVTMGEATKMTFWNTTDLALPMPEVNLKRLAAFTGPMAAMAQNPMFKGFAQLAEKMQEMEGFTLASTSSISMMGRTHESSREATAVKTGPIPASEFDVATLAPGYKKVDSPLSQIGKR
ncbi:MAG: DUF4412 domain-containing protein [Acidobacteria bacterium]|jgi:hypothetical protein|nr:DUF4412 domain-containing protein [Acidobacteriota bacterium]